MTMTSIPILLLLSAQVGAGSSASLPHFARSAQPPGPAGEAIPPPPFGDPWTDPPPEDQLGKNPAGSASLSKSEFTVQTKDTADYIYRVGPGGMSESDHIRIEDPVLHGMRWSKWGASTLDEKQCTQLKTATDEASGSLVSVSTDGSATLGLDRSTDGADVHEYAYTDVWIEKGELVEGEEITVRYGDPGGLPDCAHQWSDRSFTQVEWRSFERLGGGPFVEVAPSPTFDVVSERDPALLWVSAPSFALTGENVRLKVTVLDRLGNPITDWGETATLEAAYGGASQLFDEDNPGWLDFGVTLNDSGVHRVEVTAGQFTVSSNPIVVQESAPDRYLYWGDLHSHHGHTIEYEDGTQVDENHVYSRDAMGHDLGCESMKCLSEEIDGVNLWEELKRTCSDVSVDGEYLVILGNEWMGNRSGSTEGHHNTYFDDCTGYLCDQAETSGLEEHLQDVHDLRKSQGTRAVTVPHASTKTQYTWDVFDSELRVGAEIYSEWANSLNSAETGNVNEALVRGHRFGFFAASDNHDGWFGNPLSYKNELSGLAAFWAPSLTRADIFESLATRQTYATSGARIIVEFWAEEGSSTIIAGREFVALEPTFAWNLHGTAEITQVELRKALIADGGTPGEIYMAAPAALDVEGSYPWSDWDGSDYAVWLDVTQADGELAWSSPIWITQSCAGGDDVDDPEDYCDGRETGDIAPDSDPDTPDDSSAQEDSASGPGYRHCGECSQGKMGQGPGGRAQQAYGLLLVLAGVGLGRRRRTR